VSNSRPLRRRLQQSTDWMSGSQFFDSEANARLYAETRAGLDWEKRALSYLDVMPMASPEMIASALELNLSEEDFGAAASAVQNYAMGVAEDNEPINWAALGTGPVGFLVSNSPQRKLMNAAADFADNNLAPYDWAKNTVRMADLGFRSLQEITSNWYMDILKTSETGDLAGALAKFSLWGVSPEEMHGYWKNTTAAVVVDKLIETGSFSEAFGSEALGEGFFISEDGTNQETLRERQADYWTLDSGEIATPGRVIAEDLFEFEAGTAPYDMVSGLVDAAFVIGSDPLTYIPGGAFAKGAKTSGRLVAGVSERVAISQEGKMLGEIQVFDDGAKGFKFSDDVTVEDLDGPVGQILLKAQDDPVVAARLYDLHIDHAKALDSVDVDVADLLNALSDAKTRSATLGRRMESTSVEVEEAANEFVTFQSNTKVLEDSIADAEEVLRRAGQQGMIDDIGAVLAADGEVQRLTGEIDAALKSGGSPDATSARVADLQTSLARREMELKRNWVDQVLSDDALRTKYIEYRRSPGPTRADYDAAVDTQVDDAWKARETTLGGTVTDPPLTSPNQVNMWRAYGVIPLKFAREWIARNPDEFWAWFNARGLESQADEMWTILNDAELDAAAVTFGNSKVRYINVPGAKSNAGFDEWAAARSSTEADEIIESTYDNVDDLIAFLEREAASGGARFERSVAPSLLPAVGDEAVVEARRIVDSAAAQRAELAAGLEEAERKFSAATMRRNALEKALSSVEQDVAERLRIIREQRALGDDLGAAAKAKAEGMLGFSNLAVDTSAVIRGIGSKQLQPLLEYLSLLGPDDVATIYRLMGRGKIDADTLRGLAYADTPDAVRDVLVSPMSNYAITRAARRAANATRKGEAPEAYHARFAAFSDWLSNAASAKRVNAALYNPSRAEDMIELVLDSYSQVYKLTTVRGFKRAAEVAKERDAYVARMLFAQSTGERRAIYNIMNRSLVEKVPGFAKLSKDEKTSIRNLFNTSATNKADEVGDMMPMLRASNVPEEHWNELMNLRTGPEDLRLPIVAPDYERLSKLILGHEKAVSEAVKNGMPRSTIQALKEGFMLVFEGVVKPLMLAWRLGYVMMNLLIPSAVMAMRGMPTLATHPIKTIVAAQAINSGRTPRLAKLVMRDYEPTGRGVTGKAFRSDADGLSDSFVNRAGFIDDMTTGLDDIHARSFGRLDVSAETAVASRSRVSIYVEPKELFPGADLYDYAVSERTVRLAQQDMTYSVIAVQMGDQKILPANIQKFIEQGGFGLRDGVSSYYAYGPGRAEIDSIAGSDWAFASGTMGKSPADEYKPKLATYDEIDDYLFGDGDWSRKRMIGMHTANFDDDVVKEMVSLRHQLQAHASKLEKKRVWSKKDQEEFGFVTSGGVAYEAGGNLVKGFSNILRQAWKRQEELGQTVMRPPSAIYRKWESYETGAVAQSFETLRDLLFTRFFAFSGKLEFNLTQQVAYRTNYWERIAPIVKYLSPADARKVEQLAAKEIRYSGGRAGKNIYRDIAEGAKQAAGDGTYTLEAADLVAAKYAASRHGDMFYDAAKRNQMAFSMRLLMPFLQATANGYKVFGKGVLESPPVIPATAYLAIGGAKEEDSNWLYRQAGFQHDPSQGLLWQNRYGTMNFSVPLLGYGHWLLSFGKYTPGPLGQTDLRADSWNVVNQGEILPGLGPAITFPANQVMEMFPDITSALPDGLRDYLVPIRSVDPNEGGPSLAPTHIAKLMAAAGIGPTEMVNKFMGPAMSALWAADPDRYTEIDPNTGQRMLTEGGKTRLRQDAWTSARLQLAAEAFMSATFRGGQSPVKMTEDVSGGNVFVQQMMKEYRESIEQTGSRGATLHSILTKYGVHNVMYFIDPRQAGLSFNESGLRWANSNPEFAEQIPDAIGYFYPLGENDSTPIDVSWWLIENGRNDRRSPEEVLDLAAQSLKSAATSQIDAAERAGRISPAAAVAARRAVNTQYQENTINANLKTGRVASIRKQVRMALKDPVLAKTPTGRAAAAWMQFYDQATAQKDGATLSGQTDGYMRAQLMARGDALAAKYPEFQGLWDVLRSEIDEEE
jgi:hypothetical protein